MDCGEQSFWEVGQPKGTFAVLFGSLANSMNIFDHILNRSIAHIVRFSTTPRHFSESVAEHSFYVAYITAILSKLAKAKGHQVDHAKAISMALVHDMEEQFSGDILGPFKSFSPEVKTAIRKVNKEVIHQCFEGLPESLQNHFVALWIEEGEGESAEAQIVKAADRLALVAKCYEEVKTGNEFFRHIYEGSLHTLRTTKLPWWDDIKDEVLASDKRI